MNGCMTPRDDGDVAEFRQVLAKVSIQTEVSARIMLPRLPRLLGTG